MTSKPTAPIAQERSVALHIFKITNIAGSENHLLTLLAGLRSSDFDARFLLLVEPGNPQDAFIQAAAARGIPTKQLIIRRDLDPALFLKLWRYLRDLRPAIVHTHLIHADLHGILAAKLARVPVIVTSRHNDDDFRRRFPYQQINRILWRLADGGIAISDAIRRFVIEVEGAPPAKVRTILYGLDPAPDPAVQIADKAAARAKLRAELDLSEDAILLGMVCRLIEQKGIPYALRAFARIADDFSDTALVLAGDGDQRAELEALAVELGIADRVFFLGWRGETAPIFAALDVFLMPSLWEGFGLVLLEAMAQAVPVVGSAVSAIPEVVVDGETGILCPPRDVDALIAALTTLLNDPELRQQMGAAGRARLEAAFNPARMVQATADFYTELLNK